MSEYDPCPVVVDISNKEEMESDLYGYAMCDCTTYGEEAIRINRPFESRFVVFDCPRCGEKRWLYLTGTNDLEEIKERKENGI